MGEQVLEIPRIGLVGANVLGDMGCREADAFQGAGEGPVEGGVVDVGEGDEVVVFA